MGESDRKPFVPTDFLKFEFVSDPQISPDASRVAFVRRVVDARENKYRSTIMTAPATPAAAGGGSPVGAALPFTSGLTPDTNPRWSPDGCYLAFLSGRDLGVSPGPEGGSNGRGGGDKKGDKSGPQIWVAPTAGGEARPVTAIKGGVEEFVWSPDSRLIAFVARVGPAGPEWLLPGPDGKAEDRTDADSTTEDRDQATADGRSDGRSDGGDFSDRELDALFKKYTEGVRRITRAVYRFDGIGYLEDKRCQVFVVDVEAALMGPPEKGPAVRPVQVTSGDFDHETPAWSPDGRFLAVSACREADPDLQRYKDIWVFAVPVAVPLPAAEEAQPGGPSPAQPEGYPKLLTAHTGPFHSPAWSPDGGRVAFVGHEREHLDYTDDKLWLVEVDADGAPTAKPRCLSREFGRSFGDQSLNDMRFPTGNRRPVWSPDGRYLFLLASDHGTTHLHAVDAATGKVSQLTTGDWVIFDWSADAACRNFAFALARPDSPGDIYVGRLPEAVSPTRWPTAPAGLADLDVISRQPVTRTNAELLKSRLVSRPERFTFSAKGGPLVDGWVIRPAPFREGGKYPAVLAIHGGPMAMYASAFFFEFQLLASKGIGVIYCNPRGSQGYGEEFCAAIEKEWGTADYADLMACVDAAVKTFPWIDPERLGVTGGSYGGYMTSWIIGHTDRFRAACSTRAVNNAHSFFGTSDIGLQWDEIYHGTPWKDWENLIRQSPVTYAGNVKTPTLILHNEEDYRCPIEQGEQLFAALKKLGVKTEFIRYPGESHGMSRSGKPWHRVHRLRSIVEWFEEYLKGE